MTSNDLDRTRVPGGPIKYHVHTQPEFFATASLSRAHTAQRKAYDLDISGLRGFQTEVAALLKQTKVRSPT